MKFNLPNLFFRIQIISILLLLSLTSAFSQQIRVTNFDSNEAISDAVWKYGTQQGITNKQGAFSIVFSNTDTLFLSHLNYGAWLLQPEQVLKAIESGVIIRNELVMDVQPVTVLSLHGSPRGSERFKMETRDHLAHDAGALLNQTPLIGSIRKSGSYGFDPVLRGFKYDQLNVVIDGVQCASAACPNRMDPPISQISPNMIEQVVILKGPYSLRYGNSFGGTINFKTGDPKFSDARKIFGRISGNYETNGQIKRSEGMVGFRGKKYEASLMGAFSEGKNYTDGEGVLVSSRFSRGSVGANIGIAFSKRQFSTLTITRNFARETDFPALPMDLRKDDTWLVNASHKISFENKALQTWKTNVYATLVDHLMDNLLKNLDPRMADATTTAKTTNYGGRTEASFILSQNKLFVGADYRNEQVEGLRERSFLMGPMKGKTVYDNPWQKGLVTKSALFGEYQMGFNSLNIIISTRIELNRAQAMEVEEAFSAMYETTESTQLNPGISIGGSNRFDNGFSVGLWMGRAQRSASITERYMNYFPVGLDPYEMVGNPELKPEVNNQADLKFDYHTASTAVELTVFTAYLNNYISSEINADLKPRMSTSPGVRQFSNIGEALMTGAEISWSQSIGAGLSHYAAMAFTHGQNLVDDTPLPEIAPLDFRYALVGNYFDGKLQPEITLRQVLKQNRIALNFGETETPSFTLVDLKVKTQISKNIQASIGVQNLFDVAYYEHLNRSVKGTSPRPIYAPGRNVYFSLLIDLM